mmetsp:Transcript_20567/g.44975  ORF Transcript_20567/g.44975 Transcript_20567/m.44975 type:complete len:684 (-) Transcript_20567:35-2086(-)
MVVETPDVDLTPTPTTIRHQVTGMLREEASESNPNKAWRGDYAADLEQPEAASGEPLSPAIGSPPSRIGRLAAGCIDFGDESLRLHQDDGDLCSTGTGEDCQDEQLLAALDKIVIGDVIGASDDDEQSSADHELDLLPREVQEDDPRVKPLVQECGAVYEEVQAKREYHSRLHSELRQIQDRSARQQQESSALMSRLWSAKQALAEKLEDAVSSHQELRSRIEDEYRGQQRLRAAMAGGFQNGLATLNELNVKIREVAENQAKLVEELQEASDVQARLQSELRDERVATWQQSQNVVMAFAQPPSTSRPATPTPHARFQDEIVEECRDLDQAAVDEPRGNARGFWPFSRKGSNLTASDETSSSSHRNVEEVYLDKPSPEAWDSSKAWVWSDRNSLLKARDAAIEAQDNLKHQCWLQAQRIAELSKELALEATARSQTDSHLGELEARVAASNLRYGQLPKPEEGVGIDGPLRLREVEVLHRVVVERQAQYEENAAALAKARESLEQKREEISALMEVCKRTEAEHVENIAAIDEGTLELDDLALHMQDVQKAVEESEQASSAERVHLRHEVVIATDDLKRSDAEEERLKVALTRRQGCLRRRPQPPQATTSSQDARVSKHRQEPSPPPAPPRDAEVAGKGSGGRKSTNSGKGEGAPRSSGKASRKSSSDRSGSVGREPELDVV